MGRCSLISATVVIGISCLTCGSFFTAGSGAYAAEPSPTSAPATAVSGSAQTGGCLRVYRLDRRDPFARWFQKERREEIKASRLLNRMILLEMKIIAILWDKKKYFAVVSLPDGKSYNVSDGAKVGTHGGVISKANQGHCGYQGAYQEMRVVL